jgi:hypothetical protein
MLFNLRAGLSRFENFSGSQFGAGFDPRELGFPSSLVSQFTTLQFPRFNLGTYSELGGTQVKNYETDDTWSLQPNMSWIHGRQTLKFGAEFRRYNQNFLQPGAAAGNYTFSKGFTQANPLRADAVSGNEFASFLLGVPSSGSADRNIDAAPAHTMDISPGHVPTPIAARGLSYGPGKGFNRASGIGQAAWSFERIGGGPNFGETFFIRQHGAIWRTYARVVRPP